MFLCSLIDDLCTKEESNKAGRSFIYFDQCILNKLLHTEIFDVAK